MGDYRKWETMEMRGPQGVGTMRSERPVGMGGHRDWGVIGSGIPVGSGGPAGSKGLPRLVIFRS